MSPAFETNQNTFFQPILVVRLCPENCLKWFITIVILS